MEVRNTIKNVKIEFNILRSSHREYIETFPVDNLNGNHEDTLKNIIFDYLKHQGMFFYQKMSKVNALF